MVVVKFRPLGAGALSENDFFDQKIQVLVAKVQDPLIVDRRVSEIWKHIPSNDTIYQSQPGLEYTIFGCSKIRILVFEIIGFNCTNLEL